MGTYCDLLVADYPVFSEKSQASAIVMTMFRETDKKAEVRSTSANNPIQWGHVEDGPGEEETTVEYSASVAEVKDRLRVMGFTIAHVQEVFELSKASYLAELVGMAEDSPDLFQEEIALLAKASFTDFLSALKEIITSGIHYVWFGERKESPSDLALYMLGDHDQYYWGFPCNDLRCFLRAVLEVVPDTASVTQDLTGLVSGGYYADDAKVSELALQELKGNYSENSPVVVLTEGPTDVEAIRAALDLLYPHLTGYYAFMDLAVRSPGGVGSLVHVVKSFAGAGIENRVVALFDNDTAGHSAAFNLKSIRLPSTIRVLHYPDLEFARQYPTTGPTGESLQDINGSACSIELFYGKDVLSASGGLAPVRWRGFEDRMKRYQGEIQFKDALKTAFLSKVAAAKRDAALIPTQDWAPMHQLLNVLFDAFN